MCCDPSFPPQLPLPLPPFSHKIAPTGVFTRLDPFHPEHSLLVSFRCRTWGGIPYHHRGTQFTVHRPNPNLVQQPLLGGKPKKNQVFTSQQRTPFLFFSLFFWGGGGAEFFGSISMIFSMVT